MPALFRLPTPKKALKGNPNQAKVEPLKGCIKDFIGYL